MDEWPGLKFGRPPRVRRRLSEYGFAVLEVFGENNPTPSGRLPRNARSETRKARLETPLGFLLLRPGFHHRRAGAANDSLLPRRQSIARRCHVKLLPTQSVHAIGEMSHCRRHLSLAPSSRVRLEDGLRWRHLGRGPDACQGGESSSDRQDLVVVERLLIRKTAASFWSWSRTVSEFGKQSAVVGTVKT